MTTKLTFIAELKDRFTGPMGNATDAVRRFEQAAAKAGAAAENTSKSFEHVRNSAGKIVTGMSEADRALGRHYDSLGRVQEANGRWVKGAQKAAWANDELALAAARADKASDRQRATLSKLGAVLAKVDSGMAAAAGNGSTRLERALGKVQGGTSRMSKALNNVDPNSAVQRFGRGMSAMADHAGKAASKIEDAMSKAGKAVGLAVGALGTVSLAGGMNRIVTTEQSEVLLETIGIVGKEQEKVQALFKETALDTPYGTPDVALLGSGLLSSGMETGKLEGALQGSVDAAALSGVALSDIALPLRQIQAGGRLQGDETEQLEERMIPIRRWLAEYKDVDISEVKGMISEGNVSSDDVFAALQQGAEGGAERAGSTIKGAWMNMVSSFSMAGESFLQPLVEPLKGFMVEVKETMKTAQPFFAELGGKMAPGIAAAAEHAPKLMAALEPLGGPILAAAGSFADLLPYIVQGFAAWFTVLALILPPLISFASYLGELAGPFLPVLIPLLFAAGMAFTTWRVLGVLSPLLGGVGKGLKILKTLLMNHPLLRLATLLYAGIKAMEWLYQNSELVRGVFDAIGNAVRGVLGFFDRLVEKISDLIGNKFPKLHKAATEALNFGSGKEAGEGGSTLSDVVMGAGARLGEQLGLPDVGGRRSALIGDEDLPHHADGGFTASGAHRAILGEEGREFVIDHWATEKLAATPGAIGAISQGKVPVRAVPVPVSAGGGSGAVSFGDLHIHTPATDGAEFARQFAQQFPHHFQAATARLSRTSDLTYSTLTERGAR